MSNSTLISEIKIKITAITCERCINEGWNLAQVEDLAHSYVDMYQKLGYVDLTCREALEQPDYLWMRFFTELDSRTGIGGRPLSPVAHRTDSVWMLEYDYCFINARATSLDRSKTGTFLQATKLLPGLRSKGIHLAPFLDCSLGGIYSIDSLRMVNPATLDPGLLTEGIGPDDQVRFFVDMAHLCGMVVGFDLEPHVSQYSRIVLEYPDKFRWIRLNEQRTGMVPERMEAMLKAPVQEALVEEVRSVVEQVLGEEGLASVEPADADPEAVRRAHVAAVKELRDRGIWTLSSHNWDGVGLPDFKIYNRDEDSPVFEYHNAKGEDCELAFGGVTPFRFYDDLSINKVPTMTNAPRINADVVDFFAEIFPAIQERYGFDFVRFDYVDHVFDSVMEEDPRLPVADRCIPPVLEKVISRARRSKLYTGAMAERMGAEVLALKPCISAMVEQMGRNVLQYSSIGFDLLLGYDIWEPVDAEALSFALSFSHELAGIVRQGSRHASVLWAVDTHDSGHPLFWTKPIVEVVGSQGMLLRQFVARFATPGPIVRPKYECIGNQDMSSGIYESIIKEVSLSWVGDRNHCRRYHAIEDTYQRFREFLRAGTVTWWTVEKDWGAWIIDTDQGLDNGQQRMLCVIALERKVETRREAVANHEPLPLVPSIELDVGKDWAHPVREIYEVLLDGSGDQRVVPLVRDHLMRTGSLMPREYRLFLIRG